LAAAAGEAVAHGEARQAGAYPNPHISVAGGRARLRDASGSETIGDVELTQPIEYPGKRGARVAVASAGLAAARTERELAILELRSAVRRGYSDALRDQAASALAGLSARTARDLLDAMEARVRAGEATGVERARALLEQERARAAAASAASRSSASMASLAGWIGVASDGLTLADGFDQTPIIGKATVDAVVADHPRLRRLRAEVISLRASSRAAELAWRPDIEAGVFAAHDADSDHLGARVSIELPLWNRNQGGIAAAMARVAQAESELAAAQRTIVADVDSAWRRYERALVQADLYRSVLGVQSAALLDLARTAYAAGETNLLDLLEARRAALEIEDERIDALAEVATAVNDLITASGSERILP
jgi:outer membrane protein, heavy metal efflux system